MKRRITPSQRRHQDYLRRKGLKVGAVYNSRLLKLRHKEVRRVLEICMDVYDRSQWRFIVPSLISETYLPKWWEDLYVNTGLPQAASTTRDMTNAKAESPSGEWEKAIRTYAKNRAGENIVSVTGTLKDDLRKILDNELEADINIGIEQFARKVMKRYDELALWQVRRITQTETMISLAEAGDLAAKTLDIGFTKEWCTSGLTNTRDTHLVMDGTVVDQEEYFQLEDCRMLYPHDSSLNPPASEIINCACSCIRMPK